MPRTATLSLRRPLERTVKRGHPWLYRDALKGSATPGEIVTILDRRGRFLARGIADEGPIGARLLTTEDVPVDGALFGRRVAAAAALRDRVVPARTDTYRLLHGEGDRLAGVVCDVYADVAVLRFDSDAVAAHRETLLPALRETLEARGVATLIERGGRGPKSRAEILFGPARDRVVVHEHGMKLVADVARGQKTGLFLDHRESRFLVRGLAKDARVLNLYGYTGGFSVAAGLGGAREVVTVDLAAPAIAMAEESWRENELDPSKHRGVAVDARRFLDEDRARWDVIVADPPSFAPRAEALEGALEAYAQLHAACLGRLAEGGLYLAASCSSHVRADAFDDTLAEGARKAKRVIQILGRWGAAPDHPRLAAFPEGDYLKVVLARDITG